MSRALILLLIVLPLLVSTAAGAEAALETATFSMYCYWTGEATLGRVDGVKASRIGHWDGMEVVQVDYDPEVTNLAELVAELRRRRSIYDVLVSERSVVDAAEESSGHSVRTVRGEPHFIEPKHSLRTRHPELLELDLTEAQAIALNSWSYFGGPRPSVLTEEQLRRLESGE